MVNGVSKIEVKNEEGNVLYISIKELYNKYYMEGYNLVKCYNDEWIEIVKMQKRNSMNQYTFKMTDFSKITISKFCKILTDKGELCYSDILKHNLKFIRKDTSLNYVMYYKNNKDPGYNIILITNKYVEVDNYFVRFNEVKTEE